jgi:mannose-6-phosphate isomerase-like protein (cupin superfamily)
MEALGNRSKTARRAGSFQSRAAVIKLARSSEYGVPHGIVPGAQVSWLNARTAAPACAPRPLHATEMGQRSDSMQALTAGVTKAGTGLEGIVWSILGQTYVPKSLSETSFSWHATLPPGTFVPPHIHPTQDEFIYLFEGRLDLLLDGKEFVAQPGDLIRMPMGIPHGLFNKSDQTVKCFFWVAPTRRLYDLFWAIHSMKEQKPDEVVALAAKYEVMFLPPPPA